MAKYKIVHYINQFFAGIGGEEKADYTPELREGVVGPGMGLKAALGEDYEIVSTIICGDNYFGENLDAATDTIIEMVKKCEPDVFVAGPAFNAGRYGVACGTICKAVEERLGIPVITGMYIENPGVDMFRKDLIIVDTPNSAAGMPKVLPVMSALIKKMAAGEEILGPKEEGYIERGIRVNYFAEKRGSERALEMLVKKLKGENTAQTFLCLNLTELRLLSLLRISSTQRLQWLPPAVSFQPVTLTISSPPTPPSGASMTSPVWTVCQRMNLQPSTADMTVSLLWPTLMWLFR